VKTVWIERLGLIQHDKDRKWLLSDAITRRRTEAKKYQVVYTLAFSHYLIKIRLASLVCSSLIGTLLVYNRRRKRNMWQKLVSNMIKYSNMVKLTESNKNKQVINTIYLDLKRWYDGNLEHNSCLICMFSHRILL